MSDIILREILTEIKSMKDDMQSMRVDMQSIKVDIQSVKDDIQSMKADIGEVEQRIEHIEGQQGENTAIIKAVLHRTEELDAKFDGLLHSTATKDAIKRLDAKMDTLNEHLFNQEVDIRLLKKA